MGLGVMGDDVGRWRAMLRCGSLGKGRRFGGLGSYAMKRCCRASFGLAFLAVVLSAGCSVREGESLERFARAADAAAIEQVRAGQREVANVVWWGFDPEDATSSVQAAIDSGAAKVLVPYVGTPWVVTPIVLRSDLELVFEPGVLMLAKAGCFKAKNDSMFRAEDLHDVTLRGYGATLRMRKRDYQSDAYEKAEWRMTLRFAGCERVCVEGLRLESSGGDGIYVGAGSRGYCSDFVVRDVVCWDHHRQGISVISAENLLIENCVLAGTEGTAPQAGIDFEPNSPTERLTNCVVRRCLFEDNASAGVMVYVRQLSRESEPVSIRVEDCLFRGGGGAGIEIAAVVDDGVDGLMAFENCTIEGTALAGIAVHDKAADRARVRFVNCRCKDVGLKMSGAGFGKDQMAVPIRVTSRMQDFTERHGGIDFVDCYVYDTVARPALVVEELQAGLGVFDVTGHITVCNPHGAYMDYRCKTSGVTVEVEGQ